MRLGLIWFLMLFDGVIGTWNLSNSIHTAMKGYWGLAVFGFVVSAVLFTLVIRFALILKKIEKIMQSEKEE